MVQLRSLVRAGDEPLLAEILESPADAVVFALHDSSKPVGTLRGNARVALPRVTSAGKAALAWVNHPRTRLLRDDLDSIVTPDLAAILLAHATEPQDVREAAVLLREFELARDVEPGTIQVFPVIDTARGLVRANEIIDASPRTRSPTTASNSPGCSIRSRSPSCSFPA